MEIILEGLIILGETRRADDVLLQSLIVEIRSDDGGSWPSLLALSPYRGHEELRDFRKATSFCLVLAKVMHTCHERLDPTPPLSSLLYLHVLLVARLSKVGNERETRGKSDGEEAISLGLESPSVHAPATFLRGIPGTGAAVPPRTVFPGQPLNLTSPRDDDATADDGGETRRFRVSHGETHRGTCVSRDETAHRFSGFWRDPRTFLAKLIRMLENDAKAIYSRYSDKSALGKMFHCDDK